jgi:hypothetical protein
MPENLPPASIKFHYIKGNFFRVIHADGAIGGITPGRGIFLSLFSERGALPKVIEQALKPDGSLGDEVGRETKEGIVREVEIGIVLNSLTATKVADWLYRQVKILDESKPEQPEPAPEEEDARSTETS